LAMGHVHGLDRKALPMSCEIFGLPRKYNS
jgi:hypothetical protein